MKINIETITRKLRNNCRGLGWEDSDGGFEVFLTDEEEICLFFNYNDKKVSGKQALKVARKIFGPKVSLEKFTRLHTGIPFICGTWKTEKRAK